MTQPLDSSGRPRPSRLAPDQRRQQILDAARGLFANRPFTAVSTAEVADVAGVARSLVHHYFGGIRQLFLAVAAAGVGGLSEVPTAGVDTPISERVELNLRTGYDVVGRERETWLAVIGQAGGFGDPVLSDLLRQTDEHVIERTLDSYGDVLIDTPATRRALRAFTAFNNEVVRAWLTGECDREESERLAAAVQRALMLSIIPALEPEVYSASSESAGH